MNKIQLLVLLIVLAVPSLANAQRTAPDGPELTRLLTEFLAGASRNDANIHERFWADDLIYTRGGGVRLGKPDIMKSVRSSTPVKPGDAPPAVFSAEDIRVQQYGKVAVVAYRLVARTERDGKTVVANYYNTDVFVKRGSKWQVVSHQVTPIPEPKPSEK
jgi:ketosteroid isomerase-like protein